MDLAALARTNIATVDTDCNFAVDCCVPEMIQIKMLAMGGIPEKPVKFVYNHLTRVTFDVLAEGFKSKKRYGGKDSSFGSGQGGGASGFHLIITQDASSDAFITLKMLHNKKSQVARDTRLTAECRTV